MNNGSAERRTRKGAGVVPCQPTRRLLHRCLPPLPPTCTGSYTGEFEVTLADFLARQDVNEPRTWTEAWDAAMKRIRERE